MGSKGTWARRGWALGARQGGHGSGLCPTEVGLTLLCIPASAEGWLQPLPQQTCAAGMLPQGDQEGGLNQEHKSVVQNIKNK